MNISSIPIALTQGSPEWLQHRASCLNASDLAAAMGVSKYTTRAELIKRLATGIVPEVDAATQARFDKGHANEAAAAPLAEEVIGEGLYPMVLAAEVHGLTRRLSASFDGLTLMQEKSWENKFPNAALVASLLAGVIPAEYHPQMEQGLMLSGAEKCLFTAGEVASMWYHSNPELRAKIIPTWKQVEADVLAYVPTESAPAVVAAPVEALPAVSVRMDGALAIQSNLPNFLEALRAYVAKLPANPSTDQEFADTEAACKSLKKAEEALDAAEAGALASMSDVEAMRRMVADCKALARTTRLAHEKLVAARKDAIRVELVTKAQGDLGRHIRELNAAMPGDYLPANQVHADFGGVIKGKKTVDSIRDALGTELARAKIAAGELATRIHANIKTIKESGLMVPDAAALVLKAPEDLTNVLAVRKADQERRENEARERIRAEEQAKAEREARARLEQEQREAAAKQAAEEAAEQERERARLAAETQAAHKAWRERAEEATNHVADAGKMVPAQVKPEYQAELDAQVQAAEDRFTREHATNVVPMPTKAPAVDTSARIKLGELNARIAPLSITADGLESLGFPVVETDKNAKLYRLADVPQILATMVRHLESVQAKAAA